MKKNWYAVYTKSRCEKRVSALLTKKKIENFYPMNKVPKLGTYDLRKFDMVPLFPSFVFVHATENEMNQIRQISDVVNFVYWLGRPAQIKSVEIDSIRAFVSEYPNVTVEKTAVNIHDMMRVVSSPGLEQEENNIVIQHNRVKLILPSLGYALVAETEKSTVELVKYQLAPVKDKVS